MPCGGHFFLLITFLTLAWSCSAKITYEGYQLFNVTTENEDQLGYLRSLQSQKGLKIRFFHNPMPNKIVDILVAPESVAQFKTELESRHITYYIRSEDFQQAIDSEQDGRKENRNGVMTFKDSSGPTTLVTSKYLKMSEIDQYLAGLAKDYPNLVQLENIGTTYENRPLTVVKIGLKDSTAKNKPAIWVDSGIHAREWIAPAVGLYILNKLVTNYGRNSTIRPYIENMNWYFLPVMNPDGYEYTHTQDRMWRKNRRRSSSARCTAAWFDDSCCEGVDLNRNFAFNWGGAGASADPCDEIYRGPSAFSEPESKAVRDFITKHTDIKGFFTMHSYSQMWFYPYGDRKHSYPPDKDELATLAQKATNALKSLYGTTFKVGTAADILYESSGGSDDWAKGVAGVKYVFGLELRPSDDDSRYGFILPASFIVPSGEETWAAVRVVADEVDKKYSSGSSGSDGSFTTVRYTTAGPNGPRPSCNNKSSSCWWFQSAGYCQLNSVQQLCPLACGRC